MSVILCFFFQAEDGIRDIGVTGVQTCALPICYKLRKMKGALCTAIGTALPSFLIILAIAMFFHAFQENKVVAAMFAGIRPAVVALIAVPTFELAKSAKIGLANCWIPISSALLIWLLGVNPIYVIIAAGLGGYIYGRFLKSTE